MRKLHPAGPRETLVERGRIHRPDGTGEAWTLHMLPDGRSVGRVEVEGHSLWHVSLDDAGLPERLQVRVTGEGGPIDVTFTFFEDEVLVWRKGARPASDAIALPPGVRLLWPPYALRARLLGLRPDAPTHTTSAHTTTTHTSTTHTTTTRIPTALVEAPADGAAGVTMQVVDTTITADRDGLRLVVADRPPVTLSSDDGRWAAWHTDEGAARIDRSMSAAIPEISAADPPADRDATPREER